jgi:preflagellin peptidase FlaK
MTLICVIIALISCIYASYTDMTKGIIPNKLTFPLMFVGLILNGINAYLLGDSMIFVYTFIFTLGIFILGYLFWKLGAWAGGDVKLFTAVAALIPFQPLLINYKLFFNFPITAFYPFGLTVIINSILSILPFLLIFVFYIAFTEKHEIKKVLLEPITNYKKTLSQVLVVNTAIILAVLILYYIKVDIIILYILLMFILVFAINKLPNKIKYVVICLFTFYSLYDNAQLTLTTFVSLYISIVFVRLIILLLTKVNKLALQDDKKVEELEEGMILANDLYELSDSELSFEEDSLFSKFKTAATSGDISILTTPKGKLIIKSTAAGLTDKNIEFFKELVNECKIEDKIRVKRGVPFAPSILIGLLISLFIGDLAMLLSNILNLLL